MQKKVDVLQQQMFFFGDIGSNESLIWVNIYEEYTIDNTIEGMFSDVTQFYISEHLNTFSKYICL